MNGRSKGFAGCLAAVLVVAASAFPASALDLGEWLPGLQVSPFVSERMEYESNVFQTTSHTKDDLVFKTIPGFLLDYTQGPLVLSAGYRAEILRFLDMSDQDAEHHIALAQIKLDLPRLNALLRDDFTQTTDPPGTELTGRIKSTTNVLAPEVEYKLTERFSVGANYSWTRVDFEKIGQLDRDEHLIGGSVFWKFLPKTDVWLTYNYGQKDFDTATERDVKRHIVLVGLRGDLTAKLSSTFRIGYESREPDRSHLPSYNGLVLGGDWTYRPTERTRIMLIADRSVQESIFGNALFYVSTIGTLSVEHQFTPKLTANARVSGGESEYPIKVVAVDGRARFRSDTLWGWGGGIDYDIQKWLRVGAEFSHALRTSNFDEFDFTDDKIVAKLTLKF